MARLYYLIAVDVDRAALIADNPPEDVAVCLADELRAHLADTSVREACGVVGAEVTQVSGWEVTCIPKGGSE